MRFLPNLLTLVRLALTPWLLREVWTARFNTALWLLLAAGATDALDGFLARRYKWTSREGALLDPIADKILLSGLFLTLGAAGDVPLWLAELVVGRDLLLLAGAGIAMALGKLRAFPPSWLGKLSTIVQVATAATVVLDRAIPALPLIHITGAMFVVTAALTVASGLDYVIRGVLALQRRGEST